MNSTHRAVVDCRTRGHQWHATFEQGSLLCTACGCKASCPGCATQTIQTLRSAAQQGVKLVYCTDGRLRQASPAAWEQGGDER